MIGTIIADVRIYTAAGSLVMQAQVGDKVEGSGNTITKLTRNGVVKLQGTYYVGQTGTVAWDEVTPPPPPTVTFPQKCVWQNTDENHPDFGKKAEYQFVRVVE